MSDANSPGSSDRDRPSPTTAVIVAVLFEGGLAPLALVLGSVVSRHPLTGFAWNFRDAFLGALATLPMLGALFAARRWPVGPLRRIARFFEEEVRPILGGRPWTDFALIALAAGVGEEMLFRGVMQGALARWLGPWGGLASASVLFGLLHPITPAYALIAALLGAYLGWVWIATGNLLAVMVAHALYDFLALLILLRTARTIED